MDEGVFTQERIEGIAVDGGRYGIDSPGKPFGGHEDVRNHAVGVNTPYRTAAAEARLHFIYDHHCPMAIAQLAHTREKVLWRDDHAQCCGNGLKDDCCYLSIHGCFQRCRGAKGHLDKAWRQRFKGFAILLIACR